MSKKALVLLTPDHKVKRGDVVAKRREVYGTGRKGEIGNNNCFSPAWLERREVDSREGRQAGLSA